MVIKTKRKPTGAAAMGAGPGRPKGSQNKVTTEIKEMVVEALSELGGVAYLVDRGNDPRTATAFLGLVGKVLPLQVTGADGAPVQFAQIVRVIVEPGK
jgi:hypothetical protein